VKTDGYFLAHYRTHVANSCTLAHVSCGCNLDGPDRDCDLGWALWKVAHPRKADVQ
jgi:hypothetical protein